MTCCLNGKKNVPSEADFPKQTGMIIFSYYQYPCCLSCDSPYAGGNVDVDDDDDVCDVCDACEDRVEQKMTPRSII